LNSIKEIELFNKRNWRTGIKG